MTAEEGENVTLTCTSTGGHPPANITWKKDDKKIGKTKLRNNTVVLRNVCAEGAGIYVCTAESYPDDKYRDVKSVELIVNCKYQVSVVLLSHKLLIANTDISNKEANNGYRGVFLCNRKQSNLGKLL